MQTLTEQLLDAGLADRVFSDALLSRLLEGSSQRRYNLVNRAIKAGELIRLRRGLYMLPDKYRSKPCHPYALAHMLVPGSYVSMETALSFHGWIPESVHTCVSVVPGRKSMNFRHEKMGLFTFHPLAIQKGYFLELVERVELGGQALLMANPLRALMDLVCFRKVEWQGLSWIEQGMRIDDAALATVTAADIQSLKHVYKQRRVLNFLNEFAAELRLELAND